MSKFDEQRQEMASRLEKIEDRQDTMKQHIVQVSKQCEAKIENLESESVLRNEINAVKKKIANLQTNGIPSGSKLKTPLFDGKLQCVQIAIQCRCNKERVGRGRKSRRINNIPKRKRSGCHPDNSGSKKQRLCHCYGCAGEKIRQPIQASVSWTLRKLDCAENHVLRDFGNCTYTRSSQCIVEVERKNTTSTEINDISDVVCEALRKIVQEDQQLRNSVMRRCYNCQKPGHFARECRSRRRRTRPAAPTQDSSDSTNTESLN
uniref:CCHC-type domain-containing protein n=1 Tax=Glossina brevipalpis TaxID=37001 RepID=A0A1A9W3M6_9MUSC